jgi:hypothetical protein
MIDSATQERIKIYAERTAWPYIMVPVDQLDSVKTLLRDNRVSFWVDSHAVALNGHPAVTVINLGRGADTGQVQRLLDGAN